MAEFCERVRTLREERHLSQKELAKELKLTLNAYQLYEYGQGYPTYKRLLALADHAGLLGSETSILSIAWDDPAHTPPAACRYDACLVLQEGQTLPALGQRYLRPVIFATQMRKYHRSTTFTDQPWYERGTFRIGKVPEW